MRKCAPASGDSCARSRRVRQAGFTLIEVMYGSIVLSVLIIGMMAFFKTEAQHTAKLVLRQEAMFVANAEAERITALYNYSNFGSVGPVLTTGYVENAALPAAR